MDDLDGAIFGNEPSLEETIIFAAPVAEKNQWKVLMRGPKHWGYFGLSIASCRRESLVLFHASTWHAVGPPAVCGVFGLVALSRNSAGVDFLSMAKLSAGRNGEGIATYQK